MDRAKLVAVLVFVVTIKTAAQNAQFSNPNPQSEIGKRLLFMPAPGSPFVVGTSPADIAVADLNRDGALDIVTANGKSNDATVLLGDGSGGFKAAPGSPVALGAGIHMVVTGDMNRDGNLDLVLTQHDSNGVTVLRGDGRGGFAPVPGSPFVVRPGPKAHNHGLAVGDLNGDSNLDIITGDQDDNSVSVLLGDGNASFTPAPGSPFAVGKGPYPLALGDVNGDSKLDIVTPNTGSGDVTVLLGDGQGRFTPAPGSPLTAGNRPYYAALGDLNGDNKLDLITAHDDTNLITVFLGDGRGQFRSVASSPIDLGARAWGVVVGDINRDNRMDLVTATGNSVRVLLGDGQGRFAAATGSPFAVGRGAWKVAIGDVNRDGKLDIVTNNVESHSVTVLLGK